MNDYALKPDHYGLPTPAGAYQAVSSPQPDPAKQLLLRLISEEASPLLTPDNLVEWTGLSEQNALELLFRLQHLALLEGHVQTVESPQGPLEQILPELLPQLSGDGKALLADSQGFYLSSVGFPHETAEELSAVSAGLSSLYGRHQKLLLNNLGLASSHWALVDAAGNSRIGFWQFYIGKQRFYLVLSGLPQFNQSVFTQLIWSLAKRYATA
jgi:hypothetical protein